MYIAHIYLIALFLATTNVIRCAAIATAGWVNYGLFLELNVTK